MRGAVGDGALQRVELAQRRDQFLTLRGGLPAAAVEAIAQRVGERLAADPDVRRRIDDLAVVIHQAIEPQDAPPPLADE